MPQLPKYPSSGTSKTLESNPGQREEGSFAVPSSASRLPGFGALSGTSQLPRQLFHSPAAESAAAAEPSNSGIIIMYLILLECFWYVSVACRAAFLGGPFRCFTVTTHHLYNVPICECTK